MRHFVTAVFAIVVLLTLSAGSVSAHHSFAATYLEGQTQKIEGKVVQFLFRNPHSFLHVEAPDEKGNMQVWNIEWGGGGVLGRQGVTRDTLKPGVILLAATSLHAQGRGGRGGAQQPPPTAKAGSPIDITGHWVSLVTQDWRLRIFTPPKGDYAGIPLNAEARKIADAWDPAKDEGAGEQCRSYGAPALMRIPGRLRITWQDDQTLKLETDAGTQSRVFSFGNPEGPGGTWQGTSKASWEYLPAAVVDTGGAARGSIDRRGGSLKVVTTNMKPGYLRKNGVPYSANAVLTEYFDRVTEPNGDVYLLVTSTVEDPTYLAQPLMFSTQFKKQADASGWNPTPCAAK